MLSMWKHIAQNSIFCIGLYIIYKHRDGKLWKFWSMDIKSVNSSYSWGGDRDRDWNWWTKTLDWSIMFWFLKEYSFKYVIKLIFKKSNCFVCEDKASGLEFEGIDWSPAPHPPLLPAPGLLITACLQLPLRWNGHNKNSDARELSEEVTREVHLKNWWAKMYIC